MVYGHLMGCKYELKYYLEVHEEDADAKVNKGMGSRDEVGLLVQHEDDGSSNGSLGGTGKKKRKTVPKPPD